MPRGVRAARITSIEPRWAVEGGRLELRGRFPLPPDRFPTVTIGDVPALVVRASSDRLSIVVPPEVGGSGLPVAVEGASGGDASVDVGRLVATGIHQVDSPVVDAAGNVYLTYSGGRGQEAPVSIFRVRPNGVREPFVSGVVNATSMALDAQGRLYVSSRFEATVYRVDAGGQLETFATELGVACGLAFDKHGFLYVGDRSGTIFKVDPAAHATTFATLPSSVAAFHLAIGFDEALYVTGPTLAPTDVVYRVAPDGEVSVVVSGLGRPQGLAFDDRGALYVADALAGWSGVFRWAPGGPLERVLSGDGLIGLAFDPRGGLIVTSNTSAYRLDVDVRPAR